MNTPWYRPTRVNHVVQRRGLTAIATAPASCPRTDYDSAAAGRERRTRLADRRDLRLRREVPDQISGSVVPLPIGATASCTPRTSSPTVRAYSAELEEFINGTPLPLDRRGRSDPLDGALYFAIGGRKAASGPLSGDLRRRPNRPSRSPAGPIAGDDLRATRRSARSLPRPRRSQGRGGGLAVPLEPRPIRPGRRSRGARVPGTRAPGGTGPWPRPTSLWRQARGLARLGRGLSASDPAHRAAGRPGARPRRSPERSSGSLGKLDWEHAALRPEGRHPSAGRDPLPPLRPAR